jgi:hypothetical protein
MKARSGLSLLSMVIGSITYAQCSIDFSHADTWDSLSFTNLSTVSNAHYYWNFGDGSTSYQASPGHVFPAAGHYLVTLYGLDTVTECHGYHEEWIDVAIQTTEPCQPSFTDTVVIDDGDEVISMDVTSMDCGDYVASVDAGPGQNGGPGGVIWLGNGWGGQLWVNRLDYFSQDPVDSFPLKAEYYRTQPNHYDRAVNYDSCSANFEYHANYQADGALVTFTAMSPVGNNSFEIIGFGNPIYVNADTGSQLYPYLPGYYKKSIPWFIHHVNTLPGCTTECTQTMMVQNPNYVAPPSCNIYQEPNDQLLVVGDTAQFIAQTGPGIPMQWQQNVGLGWLDLPDSGSYSGVHTDTLTLTNVQLSWNNYLFRCKVGGQSFSCANVSTVVSLTTGVGIEEMVGMAVKVFPVPAHDHLNLTLDPSSMGAAFMILNVQGLVVRSGAVNTAQMVFDLQDLAPGVYMLSLQGRAGIGRARFVIE